MSVRFVRIRHARKGWHLSTLERLVVAKIEHIPLYRRRQKQ